VVVETSKNRDTSDSLIIQAIIEVGYSEVSEVLDYQKLLSKRDCLPFDKRSKGLIDLFEKCHEGIHGYLIGEIGPVGIFLAEGFDPKS